jgi:hypothetical protein
VAEGRPWGSDLHDAVRAAVVLDAMTSSVAGGGWVAVPAV